MSPDCLAVNCSAPPRGPARQPRSFTVPSARPRRLRPPRRPRAPRATEVGALTTTGTISDVQHVVILMQENRSFDHYFGAMKGVRGFGDRATISLPGNYSVFNQANGTKRQFPWQMSATKTAAGQPGPVDRGVRRLSRPRLEHAAHGVGRRQDGYLCGREAQRFARWGF